MNEQLSFHGESGWRRDQRTVRPDPEEIPKEFAHRPALQLCWRGLVISISEGFMSRKQAYEMLERMDLEEGIKPTNVVELDAFRSDEPPDLVA